MNFSLGTYHNMGTNSGRPTLVVHLMFTRNFGNSSSNTETFSMVNMTWRGGRLEKLLPKLANCITITSEFELGGWTFHETKFLFPLSSLRTSETNYLNEAFSFYSAIRARSYYSRIGKEDRHGGARYITENFNIFSFNNTNNCTFIQVWFDG